LGRTGSPALAARALPPGDPGDGRAEPSLVLPLPVLDVDRHAWAVVDQPADGELGPYAALLRGGILAQGCARPYPRCLVARAQASESAFQPDPSSLSWARARIVTLWSARIVTLWSQELLRRPSDA